MPKKIQQLATTVEPRAGCHQTNWWLYCTVAEFERWVQLLHEAPAQERWFMQNIDLAVADQVVTTLAHGGLWHQYSLLNFLHSRHITLIAGDCCQQPTERVAWAYLQYLYHNRRLERVASDAVETPAGRRVVDMYKYRPARYEAINAPTDL